MKKGQGLSINAIVIAAIALIVLVVLVLIFTGNIGNFQQGVQSCEGKGGTCGDAECTANQVELKNTDCKNHCCVTLGTPQ